MRFCRAKPLSHGLRRASPPGSGALGKEDKFLLYGQHADAAALPRPPLLGEVALRSKDGRVVQRRSLPVRQTLPSSPLGSPTRGAVAKRLRGSPPAKGGFFYAHFAPKSAKLWNTLEMLENLWAEHRKIFTVLSLMAHAEPRGGVVSLIQ